METIPAQQFRFAEFELDGTKRRLLKQGKPVSLNSKTFEVLLALVEKRGEVLGREELLERVWSGQFVEEGNLTVQISALRKIFGELKDEHRFIVTIPGRGYSFVAEIEGTADEVVVERHTYSNIVVQEAETFPDEFRTANDGPISTRPQIGAASRSIWRRSFLFVPLLLLLFIGAAGYWIFLRGSPGPATISSVAVMPFVNDSGNADLEYLSDGLTESLIGSLSQLPKLSVKARSSISRYKGTDIDLGKVGADLSVDSIVTGRLVQQGDKVVLYVEFVDPATESVLWKAVYDRPMRDIAALQADIARDVASRMKARISGDESLRLAKYQTGNSEAYELYLRGRHFTYVGISVDGISKGIDHFERAVQLDPNYALAYVGLANAHMRFGSVFGLRSPQDTFPKAREALIKAISIDDGLADAHGALGEYYLKYEWNWPAAERELRRATELDPDNPYYYTEYGSYYQSIGRFDDAVRARETARRLDPVVPGVVANVGYPHYYARRHDQAIEWYRKALELNPGHPWSYLWIGQSYLDLKRYPEAIEQIERAVELSERNSRTVATLGHALAKSGRRTEAVDVLNELQNRSRSEYVSPYFFAVLYAGMGDVEKVFELLEHARTERQTYLFLLNVEPVFDDVRSDPRFSELVKKIGIPNKVV